MKVGDTYPVQIAGQTIAQATVKEVGDGQVKLVVPATLVVMAVRTELAPEVPALPAEPETQRVLLTDQVEQLPASGEGAVTPEQAATQQVPGEPQPAPPVQEVAPTPATPPVDVPNEVATEVIAAVEQNVTDV